MDLRMTISDDIVLLLLKPLDQSLESGSGFDSKSTLKNLRNLFGQVLGASGTAKIFFGKSVGQRTHALLSTATETLPPAQRKLP